MIRLDYGRDFQKINVYGVECEFNDMRIKHAVRRREDIGMRLQGMMTTAENR